LFCKINIIERVHFLHSLINYGITLKEMVQEFHKKKPKNPKNKKNKNKSKPKENKEKTFALDI